MSDQSKKEIDIVMSLYSEGKITEVQRDNLLAALGYDKSSDNAAKEAKRGKYVVFAVGGMNRVDGEEAGRLCGELCNELRNVDGVRSVKVVKESGKTRAHVKGDFDVGDVTARASSMGYVMAPIEFEDDDGDDELFEDDDSGFYYWDEEEEDDDEDEDDVDDEDEEDDDDDEEDGKSDGKIWDDFVPMMNDLGEKISKATMKGINAAKNVGKKISDAVNDAVWSLSFNDDGTTIKNGDKTVIHIRHEKHGDDNDDLRVTVIATGVNGKLNYSDSAENISGIKEKCRAVLSDDICVTLGDMLDNMVSQRHVGSFNYSKNGERFKLLVKPYKRNEDN